MILGVMFRLGGLKRDIGFTTRCPRSAGHLGVGRPQSGRGQMQREALKGQTKWGKTTRKLDQGWRIRAGAGGQGRQWFPLDDWFFIGNSFDLRFLCIPLDILLTHNKKPLDLKDW